ncbi:hypothetical protein K458DRAFT_339382 [Lentithecium fluviatile CBS 122367]|uniref:Regulator of phospholipase D SRF1 n=1 Tax=Lentithecium fluviatile CBS 122367 TaxID=1168545 RepID=A0A6G1J1S7_9PLEO|nr:hypothetical protein K458DRAFT_339382 [Lentithecium fluviatile CBS 122367]
MTGKLIVEQSNGPASSSSFLVPPLPQSNSSNRLLPSPIPPPTASSASSQRPQSGFSAASSSHDRSRDGQTDGAAVRKSHSHSISSNPHTLASSGSNSADVRATPRQVRTLPPWVQAANEDDHVQVDATSLLLPRTPSSVRQPCHNFMPTPKGNVPGRRFDHAREGVAVTLSAPLSESASKWQQFAKSSDLDGVRPPSSRGQIVDDEWMKENMPDLEEPWQPMDVEEKEELTGFWLFSRRKRARFHRALMNHPMVPLAVRMIVLTFSVLALSLAGSIFHRSDGKSCVNNSSTYLAVIVDVVAIVYTCYITYDEYTSKPLGLRSHNAKMRLIFLDLAFIVFDSANLSLAFQALTDERWACRDIIGIEFSTCPYSRDICVRQKALTATLLVVLVAWIGTFTISTLRLLERVAR